MAIITNVPGVSEKVHMNHPCRIAKEATSTENHSTRKSTARVKPSQYFVCKAISWTTQIMLSSHAIFGPERLGASNQQRL
jgi:hypothetical protein